MKNEAQRAAETAQLAARALGALDRGVFILDALEPIPRNLYVNEAYEALTGHSIGDAIAPGFDALSIFSDRRDAAALVAELSGGASRRLELRRRDGQPVAARLVFRLLPSRDGRRLVMGLIEEVSAAPLATDDTLARLAAASQARDDAEAANRAKDAFFASLSHELRSPLNACVMWLDVLAVAPQPETLNKAVAAIRRNLDRQTRLVNDLVDAAKISSSGIAVHLEPLDLIALLGRELSTWQTLAHGKQVSFEHRFEPASLPVDADPQRLPQAVSRVLEHAINHTPGGGRVELRVRRTSDLCIIEIGNTGVGLSVEQSATAFTPSWSAPHSAPEHRGLTLGLAVAHHLVTQHGGTVMSAGADGGAVFIFSLPLAVRP